MAREHNLAETSDLQGDGPMIFVTVGSTQFDELIRAVDQIAATGGLSEPVVCQIGNGGYIPRHCKHYRFKPSIDDDLEKSSLVICHGGATVLSLLAMEKMFIAVANTHLADDHQSFFLDHLCQTIPILWTRNTQDLPHLIQRTTKFQVQPLKKMRLADDLKNYLDQI